VIERDGPFGLSMRAVAQELGMGTMSLYRYVQSREQLEALVVDLVLEGLGLDVSRHKSLVDKARRLAERVHASHRLMAGLISSLLGTAGFLPFISFSTNYPESAVAALSARSQDSGARTR
jgi:AcrR family transcriptional regulator